MHASRSVCRSAILLAALLVAPSKAFAGTKVLYSPNASSVEASIDPIQAIETIRGPIDQQHTAGWPCSTPALPYAAVPSYTITGRKLVIRCADGSQNEFLFSETNVAVQRDGCGMTEWPCNVRMPIEPYVIAWVGNRRFVIFFNKNDEAWARSVANAFWSLRNARPVIDPAQDDAFRAKIEAARTAPDHAEDRRRTQIQAEALINAGRLVDAAKLYRIGLESSPDWADAHYNLALVYGQLELVPEAITEMRRYLYLAPGAENARAAQDQIYAWEALR